ncbi:MAG TPA: hydrogenase formation protein HypD [Candidatus Sulfotelmatobacter sp.]|nr:hydrogenase formation protein HypD [Candidatus Sulfotelmatobacter sp.]
MKFLSEYRDQQAAEQMGQAIRKKVSRPWTIMEICGGQTHTIVKSGLEDLLPRDITLVHGPGCPVCVTPIELIDKAVAIAARPDVIFCSFGDMLRVPGSSKSLFDSKAEGADVRIVYSPLDALKLAKQNPAKQVVFFAVGFETTAPANAMAAWQADHDGIDNFSLLVSHVLVPPAMEALLSSEHCVVQGFLAAGHVCTIMGFEEYFPIAERYRVPIVVTGFEPLDILEGIYLTVSQLEEGRFEVENQYSRAVRREGNRPAQKTISEVFEIAPREWRGLGEIPASGFQLRGRFQKHDANRRFPFTGEPAHESPECISGLILQGIKKPQQCAAFAVKCTPENPLGAPMVSSEGACAAYYHYGRRQTHEHSESQLPSPASR